MRVWGFAAVSLAGSLVVIDTTIVNMALPAIRRDFGLALGPDHWVFTAYALPFGGFLLVGGRLGDLLGHRRVFTVGLSGLALASAAAAVAPSASILIGARAIQGLSAALVAPAALALVTIVYRATAERDRAIGIYAASGSLGFVVGVLVGAALTQLLGWRSVMAFNVALIAAVLAVEPLAIPPDRRVDAPARPLGTPGAIALTIGLTAILFALSETESLAMLPSGLGMVSAVIGLLLLAGFAFAQRRVGMTPIPRELFRRRPASLATAAMFLKSTIGIAGLYVPTVYLQDVRDQSPLNSAYAFIPGALAGVVVGVFGRWLIQHLGGPRSTALFGLAVEVAGLIGMMALPVTGSWEVLIAGMVVMVAGMVLADVALTIVAVSDLNAADRGVGAGMLRSAAQLGAAVGIVAINTVIVAVVGPVDAARPETLVLGLQAGLLTAVGTVALAGGIVAFGLRR